MAHLASHTGEAEARDALERKRPIVFFHVMKCGGTSVRDGLSISLTGQRDGPDVFKLDGEAAKAAAAGKHADNWRFRDALLAYVLITQRPSLVLGHFRYRDRFVPLLSTNHFVTVLRDPVERLVSLYKYRRFKETVDVPVSMGFEEFLEHKRWSREGHAYIDAFCGCDDLDPRSDEAVAAAIANLQRFDIVGCTDGLEEFARCVGRLVDKRVQIPRHNTSPAPGGLAEAEVDPSLRELARAVCAPDIQVFEQVLARSGGVCRTREGTAP